MNVADMKRQLMVGTGVPKDMTPALLTIGKNPKRPLGKFGPWAWWVELVRGCNIRCDFCPTRLFPFGKKHLKFMPEDVWVAMLRLIQKLAPRTRLEFCNAGEPTLHPDLLRFLQIGREICPQVQFQTYTNGTMLITGKLTYKELFNAGLNCLFVDMYSPFEEHKVLAEASGEMWFHQDEKPCNAPNIFEYQNDPNTHIIMLAENPYNWSTRKLGRGYLQTFFNDLDWPAAKKFGMVPVTKAPIRRCDLLNKFVNVNWDGTYIFCCFDYMRHTIGEFGNVSDGLESFFKFWLGQYMQDARKRLYFKDRASHQWCKKCRFTSIRCDIPYWPMELMEYFWTGTKWEKLKYKPSEKVLAYGGRTNGKKNSGSKKGCGSKTD